jgi:hypothetical protein
MADEILGRQQHLSEEEINNLINRSRYLEDDRRPWETAWKEIMPYVHPRRSSFDNTGEEGESFGKPNQSSVPVIALQQLADGLQGYTVSRPIRWFQIGLEDERLMEEPGAADYLEYIERHLYSVFNRSNFYESMTESYMDAGSCGTATNYTQEHIKDGTVRFTAIHPSEMFISEDDSGMIDTHLRKHWKTLKAISLRFGEENLHEQWRNRLEKKPFEKVEIRHFVFPADQKKLMGLTDSFKTHFPIVSIHVDVQNKHILSAGGYYEDPFHTWRWRKNSGEQYGRSPALDGRADILTINQVRNTMVKAAQLAVEPPLNVPESMKDYEQIFPRGFNYYSDPQAIIRPIDLGSNYPVGVDTEDALTQAIYQRFYVDFFLMLQRLERSMTAREVIERQGEKAAILGSIVGRLNNEFLDPIIRRVLGIVIRSGQLEDPPPVLRQYGWNLKIEFLGPLAQIQRSYYQSQGVMRGFQAAVPVFQMKPRTMDNFDMDELVREAAESHGMPQKIIVDTDERDEKRKQRAEAEAAMMQQQQQQQMQQDVMQNYDKLNKKTEDGSAIDALNQFVTGHGVPGGE